MRIKMSEQFDFLWNTIKERAKTLVNPISYSTFIENLVPVDVVNKKIVLQAERAAQPLKARRFFSGDVAAGRKDGDREIGAGPAVLRAVRIHAGCGDNGRIVERERRRVLLLFDEADQPEQVRRVDGGVAFESNPPVDGIDI